MTSKQQGEKKFKFRTIQLRISDQMTKNSFQHPHSTINWVNFPFIIINLGMKKSEALSVLFVISFVICIASAQRAVNQDSVDPWLKDVQYPKQSENPDKNKVDEYRKLSTAIDIIIGWNINVCSTCQSLKYFAIRPLSSTTQYLTVSATCAGTVSFAPASHPSGRPGADQLLIVTQLSDETWMFEPSNCLGRYIKATTPSTLAVQPGMSSNARHWIEYHDNHVHLQSGFYTSSYWSGGLPIQIGPGASMYIVEYWPPRRWP